jgi:hypothetical protein
MVDPMFEKMALNPSGLMVVGLTNDRDPNPMHLVALIRTSKLARRKS